MLPAIDQRFVYPFLDEPLIEQASRTPDWSFEAGRNKTVHQALYQFQGKSPFTLSLDSSTVSTISLAVPG